MLTKAPFILIFILIISGVAIPTIADQSPIIHDPPTKQEANKAANQKKNPETQNQDSTPPSPIVNPTPTPPLQEVRNKECYHYSKEQKTSWWNFSLTDALLVIFTCGLVIVGWIQICILRGTLKATLLAADAAKESADALPIMERAYVFSNIKLDRKIDAYETKFRAVLYLKNHGKTPAIIKEIGFMGYSPDTPFKPLHIHHPIDSIIGSGDEFEEDHHCFEVKASDWDTLITTKPQIKFSCLGYVKYITVFGEEDCHVFYWEFYSPDLRFVLVQSEKLNHSI